MGIYYLPLAHMCYSVLIRYNEENLINIRNQHNVLGSIRKINLPLEHIMDRE